VLVNKGVTLTIEHGVTVNLNDFYMQVDGTIRVLGTNDDPIYFNGNSQFPDYGITFTSSSINWNEETNTGSIIENSILNLIAIEINGTSPKIDGNSINGYISAHITSSPIITNNVISAGNSYQTAITGGFSSLISNNTIRSNHNIAILAYDSSTISNNTIEGIRQKGIIAHASTLYNNKISNCSVWGISSDSGTIQNNFVDDCYQAIVTSGFDSIFSNTLRNNSIAVYTYNYPSSITYNNIENSTQFSIKLDISEKYPVNATHNWWGTADQSAISNSIYDFNNDFNKGTVNFVPFLTTPNLHAMPNSNAHIPTPNTSPTSTSKPAPNESVSLASTPIVPEFPSIIVVTIVLMLSVSAISASKGKNRTKLKKEGNQANFSFCLFTRFYLLVHCSVFSERRSLQSLSLLRC
jgi:hypothetical protein